MGMRSKNYEIEKAWSAFRTWTEKDPNIELVWLDKYGYGEAHQSGSGAADSGA